MQEGTKTQVFRGEIFHLTDDPAFVEQDTCVHYLKDGLLVVEDGIVSQCVPAADSPLTQDAIRLNGLIVPGLVDTHVHYPQLAVLAAPGTQLLEWLERYTFPAEEKFADGAYARQEADRFLDAMLAAGTTTALVFATSHMVAADAMFAAAQQRDLRLITGKVLSDRNMPPALRDTPETALNETAALIKKWHGVARLGYAVTPRFAPTSSTEQLAVAGQLLAAHPGVLLHTHLSESHAEIKWVHELFPTARDYLDVYQQAGLVTDRSVFAHSIHLNEREWDTLAAASANLSFCPCSNLFLGSGLFDVTEATRRGVTFGLGSDVGGGNALSLLRVMDEAYKVTRMGNGDIDPYRLWYLATLGGAKTLGLDGHIGSFKPGREADFIVLDPQAIPLLAYRLQHAHGLAERLFALALLGDERIVAEVYVMGKKIAGTRMAA